MTVTAEPTTEVAQTSTLDKVKALVKKSDSFGDVLKGLAKTYAPVAKPKVAPLPVISEEDHQAVAKFVSVFGAVAPTTRRKLAPAESEKLMTEREVLDKVGKLVETRKTGIRTTIYHHLDIEAEEAGLVDENTVRDKDGHYILPGRVEAPGHTKGFNRGPRDGTANFTIDALRKLEDDGVISHDEFLSCSRPIRVVEDDGCIALLKRKPELTQAFADAVTYSGRTSALTLGKE